MRQFGQTLFGARRLWPLLLVALATLPQTGFASECSCQIPSGYTTLKVKDELCFNKSVTCRCGAAGVKSSQPKCLYRVPRGGVFHSVLTPNTH
jgi:hypothetical protein